MSRDSPDGLPRKPPDESPCASGGLFECTLVFQCFFDVRSASLHVSLSAGWGAGGKSASSSVSCWAGVRRIYLALGPFVWGWWLAYERQWPWRHWGRSSGSRDTAAEWAQPPSRWRDQPAKQKQSCGQHIAQKQGAAQGPLRRPSQRGSADRTVRPERGPGLALPSYLLGCGFSGELSGFALDSGVPGRL